MILGGFNSNLMEAPPPMFVIGGREGKEQIPLSPCADGLDAAHRQLWLGMGPPHSVGRNIALNKIRKLPWGGNIFPKNYAHSEWGGTIPNYDDIWVFLRMRPIPLWAVYRVAQKNPSPLPPFPLVIFFWAALYFTLIYFSVHFSSKGGVNNNNIKTWHQKGVGSISILR